MYIRLKYQTRGLKVSTFIKFFTFILEIISLFHPNYLRKMFAPLVFSCQISYFIQPWSSKVPNTGSWSWCKTRNVCMIGIITIGLHVGQASTWKVCTKILDLHKTFSLLPGGCCYGLKSLFVFVFYLGLVWVWFLCFFAVCPSSIVIHSGKSIESNIILWKGLGLVSLIVQKYMYLESYRPV